MGTVEDFSNFVNAVIDEASFDKLATYIDGAKKDADAEVIIGGGRIVVVRKVRRRRG